MVKIRRKIVSAPDTEPTETPAVQTARRKIRFRTRSAGSPERQEIIPEYGSPVVEDIHAAEPCIRFFAGEVWHQVSSARADGTIICVCGGRIPAREAFRNAHPGRVRCEHCFMLGYPGDGAKGDSRLAKELTK